jgi:N utilization substance protein A
MTKEEDDLAALFGHEVPEISQGIVQIKAIARAAGKRSKVALFSHSPSVDCIGACVGVRGVRIKNIVNELGGERVDLVRWHEAPEKLIHNALQPAIVQDVQLDAATHTATVTLERDDMPIVLGQQGLQRDLASQLCGWKIEVQT